MTPGPSLYEVLEVPRDATLQQIKKQYRGLALKYHPDKNRDDPSATDRFKQISHAYQILSDPNKRSAYDRFGESGVNALDNEFASPFVQTVGGPITILAALLFFFVVFASLLMVLAGTAAKLDGANDYSWVHSMFGVWLIDALLGIFALIHTFAFISAIKEKNWSASIMMFSVVSLLTLVISWTALVGINLDRPVTTLEDIQNRPTWLATNAPGIVALGMIFIVSLVVMKQSMHMESDAFSFSKTQTGILMVIRALSFAMPMTLLVLISKKADDSYRNPTSTIATSSWFLILAPCFFFTVLRGMSTCFSSFIMTLRGAEGWRGMFCKEVFSWIFGHLLFLVGVGLVGEKLQHPDETTRNWAVTFVPWFIIAGGGTLLLCCFTCTFCSAISQMQDMEQGGAGGGASSSPTDTGAENDSVPRPTTGTTTATDAAEPTDAGNFNNTSNDSIDSNTPIVLGGPPAGATSYGSHED